MPSVVKQKLVLLPPWYVSIHYYYYHDYDYYYYYYYYYDDDDDHYYDDYRFLPPPPPPPPPLLTDTITFHWCCVPCVCTTRLPLPPPSLFDVPSGMMPQTRRVVMLVAPSKMSTMTPSSGLPPSPNHHPHPHLVNHLLPHPLHPHQQ